MSTPMEGIVRPFADHNVFPTPFAKPGGSSSEAMVRVAIGFQGQIKTMGISFSASMSSKMGQAHRETKPKSEAVQKYMADLPVG